MLHYGLKLWTSNSRKIFERAAALYATNEVQFVELYYDTRETVDWPKLKCLERVPVTIHHTHSHGWHEFVLGEEHLKMWDSSKKLADFFSSPIIVVHPGQARDFEHFKDELKKFDDPRIYLENMAGLDIYGQNVFARTLDELQQIRALKPICFDFEKAIKSACYQKIDYRDFILNCLKELEPVYFHISGGDKDSPVDEHANLWEANFDIHWLGKTIRDYSHKRAVQLVFETPKIGNDLENDRRNIQFFKNALI